MIWNIVRVLVQSGFHGGRSDVGFRTTDADPFGPQIPTVGVVLGSVAHGHTHTHTHTHTHETRQVVGNLT